MNGFLVNEEEGICWADQFGHHKGQLLSKHILDFSPNELEGIWYVYSKAGRDQKSNAGKKTEKNSTQIQVNNQAQKSVKYVLSKGSEGLEK